MPAIIGRNTFPIIPSQAPPVGGVNFARPFNATSMWNTPTPGTTNWYNHAVLTNWSAHDRPHWYASDGSVKVYRSAPSDPLWTFNMPDFIALGYNRNRPNQSFQVRAPAGLSVGGGSDAICLVVDPVSGDLVEVWQAVVNSGTHTVTSSPGPGWARSNAITDPGGGSLLSTTSGGPTGIGNNDGVRAANFSWLGGLLTLEDWNAKKIDHALVWAVENDVLLQAGAYPTNIQLPATAGEPLGGPSAPLRIGTKVGIPSDSWLATAGLTAAATACKATLASVVMPDGMVPGMALYNSLQTYGMFLGDYAGAQPLFYCDGNGIPPFGRGTDPGGGWGRLYAHWYNDYGTNLAAIDVIVNAGILRVADYQP